MSNTLEVRCLGLLRLILCAIVAFSAVLSQFSAPKRVNYIISSHHRLFTTTQGGDQLGWPWIWYTELPTIIVDEGYRLYFSKLALCLLVCLSMFVSTIYVTSRIAIRFQLKTLFLVMTLVPFVLLARLLFGPALTWHIEIGVLLGLFCMVYFLVDLIKYIGGQIKMSR